jgi:hypothetical protein
MQNKKVQSKRELIPVCGSDDVGADVGAKFDRKIGIDKRDFRAG